MIFEIIFFLTTIIISGILAQELFKSKEWISFASKTIVFSIIIQTIEAFLLNFIVQDWNYFLLVGIILNLILIVIFKRKLFELKFSFDWNKLVLFIVLFIGFYLLYQHGMNVEGDKIYSSYPVWGDGLFHFSIANGFLEKSISEKNLEYPIYSNAKLSYPFLIDYNFYLYLNSGVNGYWFYLFFATIMSSILVFLMIEFALIVCKDKVKIGLTILFVILASSLGIFFLFNGSFNYNYSIPKQDGIFGMTPMVITDFYPRRSADLVYPLFFMFMISIFSKDLENVIKSKKRIFLGILIGLTSFFEVHFTIILLLFLSLKWLIEKNKFLFQTIVISLLFFLPNIVWILSSGNSSGIQLQPGFFSTSSEGFFVTLFVNLLPILIPLTVGIIFFKKLDYETRIVLILAFTIFIMANFIQFHKWNWDNIKFLRYAQFALIPIILLKFNKKILVPMLIVFSLSGLTTIIVYFDTQYEFSSQSRIDFAEHIKQVIPFDQVVLTENEPDNPAVYLAGRKTLNGGEGWLWSHGIPYTERNYELKRLINENKFNEINEKYDVNYFSTRNYIVDEQLSLIYSSGEWNLYYIK